MTDTPEQLPDNCDGIEQHAFEEWARGENLNMNQHPLHYLFLDPATNAARQAWKAGLLHCKGRMEAPRPAPAVKPLEWEIDEQEGDALAESILGPFNVYYDDGHGWMVQRDGHDDTWVKYPEADFGFPDRAEAIKYVDDYYERRILSALVGGESA